MSTYISKESGTVQDEINERKRSTHRANSRVGAAGISLVRMSLAQEKGVIFWVTGWRKQRE